MNLTTNFDNTAPDFRQRCIVLCTAMAGFVYQFEANLVNVALPTISCEMRLTTTYASMIPICYLIGATLALIPSQRLGDRFGLKRIFLASIVIMTLGTLICAISPGLSVLLLGRLIQGLGAGGMAALGYAIIPAYMPSSLIGYSYGRLSMAAGMGMIAGYPSGGILVQFLSWRLIFLASVPFIVALIIFSIINLPNDDKHLIEKNEKLPLTDSFLLGCAAASAVIFLSFGSETGFDSALSISSLLAFTLFALLLFFRNRYGKYPVLPLKIVGIEKYLMSIVMIVMFCSIMAGIAFLTPFYLRTLCGIAPAFSGILMLFNAAAYAIVAPFAGNMADKGGAKASLISSACIGMAAFSLFSFFSVSASLLYVVIFLIVIGAANGMFAPSATKTALGDVPFVLKKEAAVFIPLAINIGNSLGISLFETIFSLRFNMGEAFLTTKTAYEQNTATAKMLSDGFSLSFMTGGLIWFVVFIFTLKIFKTKIIKN